MVVLQREQSSQVHYGHSSRHIPAVAKSCDHVNRRQLSHCLQSQLGSFIERKRTRRLIVRSFRWHLISTERRANPLAPRLCLLARLFLGSNWREIVSLVLRSERAFETSSRFAACITTATSAHLPRLANLLVERSALLRMQLRCNRGSSSERLIVRLRAARGLRCLHNELASGEMEWKKLNYACDCSLSNTSNLRQQTWSLSLRLSFDETPSMQATSPPPAFPSQSPPAHPQRCHCFLCARAKLIAIRSELNLAKTMSARGHYQERISWWLRAHFRFALERSAACASAHCPIRLLWCGSLLARNAKLN